MPESLGPTISDMSLDLHMKSYALSPLQLASDPLFQMIKGTTCNPSSCSRQPKISLVESFDRDAEKKLHMLSNWVRCVRTKIDGAFFSVYTLSRTITIDPQNLIQPSGARLLCTHKDKTIISKEKMIHPRRVIAYSDPPTHLCATQVIQECRKTLRAKQE